jgi:sensor histidine kinase regulating citrate/malate metabolism
VKDFENRSRAYIQQREISETATSDLEIKGFVEAQGGSVKTHNQSTGAALFTIHLPKVSQYSLKPIHE